MSERRAKLLGLDAPTTTKTEMTGSLGVYAERLAAERELFRQLDVKQLEELAADSQALVDKAMAMARANALPPQETVLAPGEPVDAPPGNETAGPASTPVIDDARDDAG